MKVFVAGATGALGLRLVRAVWSVMKASIFMVAALAGAGTPTSAESVIGTVLAHGDPPRRQLPAASRRSLTTAEKNALTFDVLSGIRRPNKPEATGPERRVT